MSWNTNRRGEGTRVWRGVVALGVVGTLLAACGSDEKSGSTTAATTATTPPAGAATTTPAATIAPADTSSATTAGADTTVAGTDGASGSGLQAAQATVDKYSTVPDAISQTVPLKGKPEKKKVGFVVCSDPSCAVFADPMKEATDALGWDLQLVNSSATDVGAAVQQLIDAGVDYIGMTSPALSGIPVQAKAMEDAGIELFQCDLTDTPGGPDNNVYSDCYDSRAAATYVDAEVAWTVVDSGSDAHILAVSIPSYDILKAETEAMKVSLAKYCDTCSMDELDVTIPDLVDASVPDKIVSYLQTHTDINYVFFTFSTLDTGVASALDSSGLADTVKLFGTQAAEPQLQEVIDGKSAMWQVQPQPYQMWVMVDQMARVAEGTWSVDNERVASDPPFFLVDNADLAKQVLLEPAGWPGPDGYQDAFKKLWGV